VTEAGRRGAAVLGAPIAHSLSPVLHRAAYAALGLKGWDYRAVECDEAALPETLRALESEGLAGVSLTMPLKRAVLPLLARTDRMAADLGAANTVLFGGVDGDWWGANTDAPGFVAALRRAEVGPADLSDVHVIGAGATAAAALAALAELGVTSPVMHVRRADALVELQPAADRLGVRPVAAAFDDLAGLAGATLVVSTTPGGATDSVAAGVRHVRGVLFDVVYAPFPTRLAAAWSAHGGRVIGGLELLVEQAALQVELMTGRTPPLDVMRAAGAAALSQ
jgi:shikimate dehydrogenase